ncbi:zf-HC2 domain-containing protein [bacterium]|nr:zf-HC2 domain-containing protein [bacterium]
MEITCVQMDVLISFYIEGELTSELSKKVEDHLRQCPTCRAKYNILSSLFSDMKKEFEEDYSDSENDYATTAYPSREYKSFKNNLSAYIDNELPYDENIKIKKYTIKNKKARKELEENYNIRKLMNDSFSKTKSGMRQDFSRNVMKKLDTENRYPGFNPLIKVGFAFIITVLIMSAIIIYALSM